MYNALAGLIEFDREPYDESFPDVLPFAMDACVRRGGWNLLSVLSVRGCSNTECGSPWKASTISLWRIDRDCMEF
jgi:hypothetical protein